MLGIAREGVCETNGGSNLARAGPTIGPEPAFSQRPHASLDWPAVERQEHSAQSRRRPDRQRQRRAPLSRPEGRRGRGACRVFCWARISLLGSSRKSNNETYSPSSSTNAALRVSASSSSSTTRTRTSRARGKKSSDSWRSRSTSAAPSNCCSPGRPHSRSKSTRCEPRSSRRSSSVLPLSSVGPGSRELCRLAARAFRDGGPDFT